MGKKKFLELVRLAAQPLPPEDGKLARSDVYSGKRTPANKALDTEAKSPRKKSGSKNS